MIIDERTERQRRWGFRAICAEHATSVLSRYRNAAKAIGLDSDTPNRQLFVLRSTPWPTGRKTEEERADFAAKGGLTIPATVGDLKTFSALRAMRDGRNPDYHAWLVARQPAHGTDLLARRSVTSAEPAPEAGPAAEPRRPRTPASHWRSVGRARGERAWRGSGPSTIAETGPGTALEPAAGTFRIGATLPAGKPVSLDLEVLRRHAVLFAGRDREDRPPPPHHRGMRPAGGLDDRPGPEQRPCPARRRLAGVPAILGRWRSRASARVPGQHRCRALDSTPAERAPADVPATTRVRRCHRRSG